MSALRPRAVGLPALNERPSSDLERQAIHKTRDSSALDTSSARLTSAVDLEASSPYRARFSPPLPGQDEIGIPRAAFSSESALRKFTTLATTSAQTAAGD